MKKTTQFYNWYIALGGGIFNYQLEEIDKKMNTIPLTITSTLKQRAEQIKQMHNYKFNFKNR